MATDTGYDPSVWHRLCNDLALAGVHIPQNYGGQGFSAEELAIVVEEMGRALLCAPYFSSTVLAATAILNAGTEADKVELLPPIAAGDRLAALAVTETAGRWDASGIEATVRDGRLSGTKSFVVDGHIADLLVVAARRRGSRDADGLSFYVVDAAADGLSRRLLTTVDATRKLARIDFDRVQARLVGGQGAAGPALERTLDLAAVAPGQRDGRRGRSLAGVGRGIRQHAGPVRPRGRLVPSDQASLRRSPADRRVGQVRRLPSRERGGRGRCRSAGTGKPCEGVGQRRLHARRSGLHPDPRRHRFHLGQRYAPLVQARQEFGSLPRRCGVPSRASDAPLAAAHGLDAASVDATPGATR